MTAAAAIAGSPGDDRGMRIAASVSAALHVAFLLFALLGLPQFFRTLPPADEPLVVEALPLAAITNAPPSEAAPRQTDVRQAQPPRPAPPPPPPPQAQPAPPAPPPPTPQPAPPQPAPPQPSPPQPAPPPPPQPEPPPPAPVPAPPPPPAPVPAPPAPPPPTPAPPAPPPPAPAPPAPPPPQPAPPPPAPAPPRPAPPAPTPPAPQRAQQPAFDPDALLRTLRPTPQQAQQRQQQAAATPGTGDGPRRAPNAPFDPLRPLSSEEVGALRRQVEDKWVKDPGARGIDSFVVDIRVTLDASGVVKSAEIVKTQGAPADSLNAFAQGARRAVFIASPLRIPQGRSDILDGNLILTFRGAER
jgi:outer membrane biosynthesis protein TonB